MVTTDNSDGKQWGTSTRPCDVTRRPPEDGNRVGAATTQARIGYNGFTWPTIATKVQVRQFADPSPSPRLFGRPAATVKMLTCEPTETISGPTTPTIRRPTTSQTNRFPGRALAQRRELVREVLDYGTQYLGAVINFNIPRGIYRNAATGQNETSNAGPTPSKVAASSARLERRGATAGCVGGCLTPRSADSALGDAPEGDLIVAGPASALKAPFKAGGHPVARPPRSPRSSLARPRQA